MILNEEISIATLLHYKTYNGFDIGYIIMAKLYLNFMTFNAEKVLLKYVISLEWMQDYCHFVFTMSDIAF